MSCSGGVGRALSACRPSPGTRVRPLATTHVYSLRYGHSRAVILFYSLSVEAAHCSTYKEGSAGERMSEM